MNTICTLMIAGMVLYEHSVYYGEYSGLEIRAEVGLVSRNIKIHGEMADECYPPENVLCNYFSYDTFGGHIMVR